MARGIAKPSCCCILCKSGSHLGQVGYLPCKSLAKTQWRWCSGRWAKNNLPFDLLKGDHLLGPATAYPVAACSNLRMSMMQQAYELMKGVTRVLKLEFSLDHHLKPSPQGRANW